MIDIAQGRVETIRPDFEDRGYPDNADSADEAGQSGSATMPGERQNLKKAMLEAIGSLTNDKRAFLATLLGIKSAQDTGRT